MTEEQNKLAEEIEHLYSLCSADWTSLKRDFVEANRHNWIVLCDQGLRNLEALRKAAQEAVGEVLSQDISMRELRDQRDRAMEAHVAALREPATEAVLMQALAFFVAVAFGDGYFDGDADKERVRAWLLKQPLREDITVQEVVESMLALKGKGASQGALHDKPLLRAHVGLAPEPSGEPSSEMGAISYAITLLETEHDWEKCLQYLRAVEDRLAPDEQKDRP